MVGCLQRRTCSRVEFRLGRSPDRSGSAGKCRPPGAVAPGIDDHPAGLEFRRAQVWQSGGSQQILASRVSAWMDAVTNNHLILSPPITTVATPDKSASVHSKR